MTQLVTVSRLLSGDMAEVTLRRSSACAHDCKDCGGCLSPDEWITVSAHNAVGASPGDSVLVESKTGSVIGLAALAYLLPPALFITGYAVGGFWGEAVQAPAACLAFVAGMVLLIPVNSFLKRRKKVFYTIVSISAAP